MPAETLLTRTLGITFLDARILTNGAKLNLGIDGYPSEHEEERLIKEAIRLYESSSAEDKQMLKQAKGDLDSVKFCYAPEDSCHSDTNGDASMTSSRAGGSPSTRLQGVKRRGRSRILWRTKSR